MKKILLFLAFCVVSIAFAKAQNVSTYAFTQVNGSYSGINGTEIIADGADSYASALTNIGFNFTYHGTVFTQFAASSNGFITLGSVPSAFTTTPMSSIPNSIAIFARDGEIDGNVEYLLSGTAPNRVLTVQYDFYSVYWLNYDDEVRAQIKLYETTNVIEIIYRQGSRSSTYTGQVGINGAATTDFNVRTTTTNWAATTAGATNTATMTWSTTSYPANGQTYRWTPPPPCSGTPTPGNTLASSNPACSGVAFTLSLSSPPTSSGITYQWQSSPDNVTWSNIAGATSATYSASQTAATYYRCLVTCTNGGASAYSTFVYVTMNTPSNCYCIPSGSSSSYFIDDFSTTGGLSNITNNNSGYSATGYGNFTGLTVTQLPGNTVNFSITNDGGSNTYGFSIWVDWNQDGDFADAGEQVFVSSAYATSASGSFAVPMTATVGCTRMRVTAHYTNTAPSNPCLTSASNEFEDYTFCVNALPACSGTPAGGTTTASSSSCGHIGPISVTGSTLASGLTYQWYSAPTSTGPWTLIAGATGITYTPIAYGLYYRRLTTCTSSGGNAYSTSFQYNSSAPINDECVNAITLTVNSDDLCGTTTSGTTVCASNSGVSACVGSGADDDVWFKFVATSTDVIIELLNITGSSTDLVHEMFSGSCGSLSSIACSDPNSSQWSGLTVGQTYYIRVYTYYTGDDASFDICLGTPPPPPSNDDPCGAIPLFVNTGSCAFQTAVLNISTTATSGIPAPGCGSLSEDIWFTAVVPASGRLIVDIAPNGGPTDFDMAWYSAPNCSGPFTLIECDSYDSQNGSTPMICRTGALCTVPGDCQQNATLTPGQTVYVRVWEYGGGTTGPFDICAYEPSAPGAPSNCSSPTNIASLPFAQGNTTCCRNDDYTSADGCGSSYQDGEDFMYTYTPSANETIDITLTGTLTYAGVFVTDRCPSLPSANCIGSSTSSSGNPLLCGVNLIGGTTYYIMIDTEPGPTCTPFNINITESSTPSCGLNYTASTIAFAPDLNNGTNIALPVDDRFSSSYIPIGFPFCYDGFQHTQLLVSSNGYVIFDPIGCASNLPSANASPGGTSDWDIDMNHPNTTEAPRNCIMFPFHDIYPSNGGTIKYQTLGTAPNRRFVLTFANVPYFSCTSIYFSGQLKLYETSNNIEVHILNKPICATWNEGGAVLGLNNYSGTTSIIPAGYNYSTPWTASSEAWRFTCNCVGCVVLPVELVEFTGEKLSSKTNYLKWTTATELNNDYFEVERRDEFSEDFVTLDRIDGAGNSNALLHYSYTDIDAPTGAAYYRLKQVDTDGKFAYSSTIVIGDVGDLADINSVYPNPAKDRLNIKLNSDGGEIKISLVSMNGQEIVLEESTSLYGFNEVSYDVSNIPSGMYYLRVSSLKNEIYYKEKVVIE